MSKKQFVAAILIFSLCLSQVFSAKKKQKNNSFISLSQIDELIKETRYDQALEELNKLVLEKPESFDQVQTRIEKIMTARNKYARLAEELIQVIVDDPDNSEKIYKITSELERLEKYPSDQQLAFISETRRAAEFSYFRKEYNRINEESESLFESGDYVAVVTKSREGFSLYQERFFEENTDEEIVVPVKEALEKVDQNLVQYSELQKTLSDSVNKFIACVQEENQEGIAEKWSAVQADFINFANIRNGIYESGEVFGNAFEKQKETSEEELTDASFLPFVKRFTIGQPDKPETGIAGAMNGQWYSLIAEMKKAVDEKLDKYVQSFLKSMPDKIMTTEATVLSSEDLPVIKQYSSLAIRVNSLNNQLSPDIYESETDAYDSESHYAYDLPVRTGDLYTIRQRIFSRFDKAVSISIPENPAKAEMEGQNFPSVLLGVLESISFTQDEQDFLKTVSKIDCKSQTLKTMGEKFSSYAEELNAYTRETLDTGHKRLCDYVEKAGVAYVEDSRKDYDAAYDLYKGNEGEDVVFVQRFPKESQEASEALNLKIDTQLEIINRHVALLKGTPERSQINTTLSKLNNFVLQLNTLKNNSNELALLCRTQLQNSEKAVNEAELRCNQAEFALEKEDFDTARKRLQDSRLKYNEALSFAYSKELQVESDKKLMALGNRITQRENEIVVADVRRLKTLAKNEYYAGNFEQAENYLTQAAARWAVTNVDEDMEISSLVALVNSALGMKTGRVIQPSAPLYPEMSQILSVAAQYYAEGESLIAAGKRNEGVDQLKAALQKIQEVQLVYPLNQEASLLSMRVQRILNPTDFENMFSRKVASAKANYKDKNKQQESYADLLDLSEINPNYPGLKDLIYNVELEIGIKQRPVTKVVSNKSQDLTKEAQSIFNRADGDEEKLKTALAKLDQAIALNPNNTQAINLKDKIQVSIGGNAAAVLSAEDESRYQTAIQELQNNNIITANAIVEQLLQKSSNKNSTKILELRKKIKALL